MELTSPAGIGICAGIAVLFFLVGFLVRKLLAEKAIKSAEAESKRIIEDAKKAAETAKKEKLVEAKEEALKILDGTAPRMDFESAISEMSYSARALFISLLLRMP